MATNVSKYEHKHFHMAVGQEGTMCYDYTDYLPTEGIKQFGALAAMVDGQEYKQACSDVAQHFLTSHNNGVTDLYYFFGGPFMTEGIYNCTKPCYISPAMN